ACTQGPDLASNRKAERVRFQTVLTRGQESGRARIDRYFLHEFSSGYSSHALSLFLNFPARAILPGEIVVRLGDVCDLGTVGVPEQSPPAKAQGDGGQVDRIADRSCQQEIAVAGRAAFEGFDPCGIAPNPAAAPPPAA